MSPPCGQLNRNLRGDYAADLADRVRTAAAARAPVPHRRPAARRVGSRPAKPAPRDHARRVFARRAPATLHALAAGARAGAPAPSYRTPLWVGPPTTILARHADVRRPAHRR